MIITSKIKHVTGLPVIDSDDVEGGSVTFKNISELKNFVVSKRHYGIYFVINYDVANENSTNGAKRTFVYKGSDFLDVNWQNLMNWETLDFIQSEHPLIVSNTYDEIATLKTANNLREGAWYVINDYKTYFRQPQTNIDMIGSIEPLCVLATSNNTLSMDAKSLLHPQDTILLDFDFSHTRAPNAKGFIIYRSIRNTFTTFYDSRAIKYRRYKPTVDEWVAGTFNIGIWTHTTSGYWVSLIDGNTVNPETDATNWKKLQDVTDYPYILTKPDQFSWLTCDGTEYEDVYTLHDRSQTGTSWWDTAIQEGLICDIKLPCWNSSNNVFVCDGTIKEIYVGDSKNNTFISTQHDTDSLQIDYVENCVIGKKIESAIIEHLTNSYVDGMAHSRLESNINNARMFSNDANEVLAHTRIKGLYNTPNTITIYGGLIDCMLTGVSDLSVFNRHVGVVGRNWRNVNIPKNITLKNVVFDVPQWYGGNTWSNTVKAISGVRVSKYYADDLVVPTTEKLWYEICTPQGSTTLHELT